MTQSIWAILGLHATRDIGEIKRAYAAKLKAIDMDADPGAFQTLREARDIATRLAEHPLDDGPFDSADEVELPELGPVDAGSAAEPVPEAEPATEPPDPTAEELNQHHQALCAILFDMHGDTFYAATPEEEQAMLRHFEAIAANPKVQNVDTLSNAAQWFAGAIAQMTPRSDALIEPASRLFGWDQADELAQDPALAAVMQRRADLRFRNEVSHPAHPLHGAWAELSTPADESSRRGRQKRKKVLELLAKIRSEHPTLERQLDWYRISLWENQNVMTEPRNLAPLIIGIFLLLRLCTAAFDGPDSSKSTSSPTIPAYEQPQQAALSSSSVDIDRAISNFSHGEIDGNRLQLENPPLYQLLRMVWHGKKEEGASAMEYRGRVRELLNDHLGSLAAYADDELLADQLRLDRDIARWQGRTSAEACKLHFTGEAGQLHPVLRERELQLRAQRILAVDPDQPVGPRRSITNFRIPGDVMVDIGRRTGMGQAEVSKALDLEGDALAVCKVRLALLDSVLELPPVERTRILRDMGTD